MGRQPPGRGAVAGRLRHSGLFERLDALSVAYQAERTDLEIDDLTALAFAPYVVMKLPTLPTLETLSTLM